MPTPKYLFTTYASCADAMSTIDTWLTSIMGYTRNLAPTADTVTFTGIRAHYQYTFVTGETIYLNFHTDTTNSKLYLTTSRDYSVSNAWNAQTGTAKFLSGACIYGWVNIPTSSSNNALYLFGDDKGNCQAFIQRGVDLSIGDLLQWGMLDKSGFGTWAGGCYFDSWQIQSLNLSSASCTAPMILNGAINQDTPVGAIDVTVDSKTDWSAITSFAGAGSSKYEPPASIGTTASYYSSIITGSFTSYKNSILCQERAVAGNYIPSTKVNVIEDLPAGFVNMITGTIALKPNPTIYVRHEATQRLSPIGRVPFGYHCPIAGTFRHVAPGTHLVQDGRTFIIMGNIAAEMVSV